MMENKECCGYCKHCVPDDVFPSDWMCVNENSENFADFVDFDEKCDSFEKRPRRRKDKNNE